MPHVNVFYRKGAISESQAAGLGLRVVAVVAEKFAEPPNYVSMDVSERSAHSLNTKDVDVEVDAAPDGDGRRKAVAAETARAIAACCQQFFSEHGIRGTSSGWVRIFETAEYALG